MLNDLSTTIDSQRKDDAQSDNRKANSKAPQLTSQQRVFIKTYGCQMNVYDSNRMQDALSAAGYAPVGEMADADLVLLNTCHIREKAAEKIYSELGRIRQIKKDRSAKGQSTLIGVAGCVAQAEGEEIIRRAPIVDLVIGPQSYHRLPGLVARVKAGEAIVETEFPQEDKFGDLPLPDKKTIKARGVTAFLTVQEGCDKFCTFCVVPYTRGAEFSRPVDQIMTEAREFAAAGVREITLLGQNVNAYHGIDEAGKTVGLGQLLRRLAEIKGLDRLRYTTSHPRDMDEDLIAAHRELPQLMPYLHLPVQSGSDRILAAMNRKHTARAYVDLIERIRKAQPDLAISGDFIVGFPGETDDDFEATLALIREVGYAQAFSFKYSPRPGTPGAALTDHVPEEVKSARLATLQALLTDQQRAFQQSCIGRVCDILLERKGRHPGQLVGRSPWLQPVQVDAPERYIGEIIRARIVDCGANSLFAETIDLIPMEPAA